MFRSVTTLLTAGLVAGSLVVACTGDSTDPDAVESGVSARFAMSNARTGQLVVDSLIVQVAEVVFDAEGPSGSISLTQEQQRAVDVTSGTADADLIPIALTPGQYDSPYLGVEIWDDGPEPAIVLTGTLDGVPIRFVFNSAEVFEAESDLLVVPEGEVRTVEFTLHPSAWFGGVDGTSLTVGSDGVAEISETSNASVFDVVADLLDETTDGRFPGGESEDTGDEEDTGDTGDTGA